MLTTVLVSVLAAAGLSYVSEPRPETSAPTDTIPQLEVPAAADTLGTIAGTVLSEMSGSALPFAVVEIVSADRPISSVTDGEGRYRLSAVPPGPPALAPKLRW